jgi:hypothetical protein
MVLISSTYYPNIPKRRWLIIEFQKKDKRIIVEVWHNAGLINQPVITQITSIPTKHYHPLCANFKAFTEDSKPVGSKFLSF